MPSISYQNVLQCFAELTNPELEFDVDLDKLKKTIDQKHTSLKSVLRYRRVLFTNSKLGAEKHRLTISLQKWVKGAPIYDYYLEKIDKDNIAEIVNVPKEKFKNVIKEVPQKYLVGVNIQEDEYLWLDTKPGKVEMSYKISNERIIELDLSSGEVGTQGRTQLRCESKKTQGVLCLCLQR